MIDLAAILNSPAVFNAIFHDNDDLPVYARFPDGTLHEIDGVSEGQLQLRGGEGLHDVIVFAVSDKTSEEA